MASPPAPGRPPARRTQAERRAITRASITSAALGVLADGGYTAMTFAEVAARAGASRGAMLHYFPQKSDLALGAIEDGVVVAMRQLRATTADAPGGPIPVETVLDAVFAVFCSPLYQAYLALEVHARTDPALHERLRRIVAETQAQIEAIATEALNRDPDAVAQLAPTMRWVTATVRGLVLIDPAERTSPQTDETWQLARRWFADELTRLVPAAR